MKPKEKGNNMPELEFTPREELSDYEWDSERKDWNRPDLDRETLKRLSERNTLDGLVRIGFFVSILAACALATIQVSRYSLWLAIPILYLYYFFYGFWVAIAHELQHKTVFARSFDWFSEIIFFFIQVLIWNSPRYARISHRLHHRHTMVRGIDPETEWPEVITSKWLRKHLLKRLLRFAVVGAVYDLFDVVKVHIARSLGRKDRMMRDHCSDKDIAVIRIESLAILLIHVTIAGLAIWFRRWEPIAFVTLAWQIGTPFEDMWHTTEHIGRLYNVKDQRLCTRSIRVSPFIKLIFWGLDDHVDHHCFPVVPSRNLPELHGILSKDLAEPKNMVGCWQEMFAIAREKDNNPTHEYVPVTL
ncbi:MAG: fatty acid desaturase [Kiritimatiellia bacterium]|nr:fatty acid desaturase [Kiritimatiellia bacterium]